MRRKITASVDANIMTTTITITSVCRLLLNEGSVLLQSACASPRPSVIRLGNVSFDTIGKKRATELIESKACDKLIEEETTYCLDQMGRSF